MRKKEFVDTALIAISALAQSFYKEILAAEPMPDIIDALTSYSGNYAREAAYALSSLAEFCKFPFCSLCY